MRRQYLFRPCINIGYFFYLSEAETSLKFICSKTFVKSIYQILKYVWPAFVVAVPSTLAEGTLGLSSKLKSPLGRSVPLALCRGYVTSVGLQSSLSSASLSSATSTVLSQLLLLLKFGATFKRFFVSSFPPRELQNRNEKGVWRGLLITSNFAYSVCWILHKWPLPYLSKLFANFINCNNDIVKSDRRKAFLLPFAVQSIYNHHKLKFTVL